MGKGKELATETSQRLDNVQSQLVEVLKQINGTIATMKNEVTKDFEVQLTELEDRMTQKLEDSLSSLRVEFEGAIEVIDSKVDDVTQQLSFMEIRTAEARTKLENSTRTGLTLVQHLKDRLKANKTDTKRKMAALRRNLSKCKKDARLEMEKLKLKIKGHASWYKFELQKLRRTSEDLQTSNEGFKLDGVSTKDQLEDIKEELRKYGVVDLALLKDNVFGMEKQRKEADIRVDGISKRITKLETMKPTKKDINTKVSRLLDDVNMLKDSIECFYCRICGGTFATTFRLKTHLQSKHNTQPTE